MDKLPNTLLPEWATKNLPLDNQFFTGGLGLAMLGVAGGVIRGQVGVFRQLARRHLYMSLEITSNDSAYYWALDWIKRNSTTRHLSLKTTTITNASTGAIKTDFDFVPGLGRHIIWRGWRPVYVYRERKEESRGFSARLESSAPWETVTLTTLGRDLTIFADILEGAKQDFELKSEQKTVIFKNYGDSWREFATRSKRSLESVILADGISNDILTDVLDWKESAQWYQERGIPYRRGYLLHGPPGSGKSSFIMALAGHLNYNICMLSLCDSGLTDDRLAESMSNIPSESIVLLEDIDAAFRQRDSDAQNFSAVTFSGLLNTLDGVTSSEERLLFMTTNHIDALDKAIMRPGRVDRVYHVGDATDSQAKRIFSRFYGLSVASGSRLGEDLVDQWCDAVRALPVKPSMAELQGHLLNFKFDAKAAVETVPTDLQKAIVVARNEQSSEQPKYQSASAGGRRLPTGRRLTASEIDKMRFRPQDNWESQVEHAGSRVLPPQS